MRNFKELYEETRYLTEARSRGEAMEDVIVAAVNGKPEPRDAINQGIPRGAGKKIAEQLNKKYGVSGKAVGLGAGHVEVTKKWAKHWEPDKVESSTKTPKTDFKIGNYKISLKTGDAAQLMSGSKREAIATFYAAVDGSGVDITGVVKKVERGLNNLHTSTVAQSDLRSEIKKGRDKIVVAANQAHKLLMADMKTLFAENTSFAYHFAKEAMTGQVKFGGNDGTCDHFLCVSDDGSQMKLIPTSDRAYISKVSKLLNVSVRFKSTSVKRGGTKSGEYRWWSAVALIADGLLDTQKEMASYEARGEVLTEGVLANIWNKFVSFVKNLVSGIVDWISRSWKNLIEFLGMDADVDSHDPTDSELRDLAFS